MPEARKSVAPLSGTDQVATTLSGAERSGRWPVLVLLWGGAKWLALATVLGILVSLRFHSPSLLADSAWLSYGRVQPVFWNVLLYGFALPSAWGAGFWMLTHLGGGPVGLRWAAITGSVLWNLGVVVGVIGILAGDSTGYPWLEMPGYASPLLGLGCLLVSMSLLATFRAREQSELHPAQWLLLAAIFWFPWVFSTAQVLLVFAPVRGIMQAIVAWWFGAQLVWLILAFFGLAVLWTLIPRMSERPLHSRYLALFAFWLLVLFTGWRGIPTSAPVPAWLPSVSTVFAVFSVLPLLAVATSFHRTLSGRYLKVATQPAGKLVLAAAGFYLLSVALGILQRLPGISRATELTFSGPAVQALMVYGVVGSAVMALSYLIVPSLLQGAFGSPSLSRYQMLTWVAGVTFHALPLALSSPAQGAAMNDAARDFMDAFRPGLMALRLSTLGDLILVLSAGLYVVNFGRGWMVFFRLCYESWKAELLKVEPAEALR